MLHFRTLTLLAALLLGAACNKTIDINDQAAIALPTYGSNPLLRREEVTVRAFFISQDRAFAELGADCVITGPHGRTKIKSPQKVLVPVYAGKAPTYKTTCKAVIGASERTGNATMSPIDPAVPATADNAPTYDPRGGVPFLIK